MLIYNNETRETVKLVLLDDNGHDWLMDASQADDAIIPLTEEQQHRYGTFAKFQADPVTLRWWSDICDMQRIVLRFRRSRSTTEDQRSKLDDIAADAWDMQRGLMVQLHMIDTWQKH